MYGQRTLRLTLTRILHAYQENPIEDLLKSVAEAQDIFIYIIARNFDYQLNLMRIKEHRIYRKDDPLISPRSANDKAIIEIMRHMDNIID